MGRPLALDGLGDRPLHQALPSYVVTVMTERLSFASKVIGVLRR